MCSAHDESFILHIQNGIMPEFSAYMQSYWGDVVAASSRNTSSRGKIFWLKGPIDIPQLLLWYLNGMYTDSNYYYRFSNSYLQDGAYSQNLAELKEVVELLDILN